VYQLIHTKEEKKIWMDGDGYRGKDTRPHTQPALNNQKFSL
jgi:hypothetical protein